MHDVVVHQLEEVGGLAVETSVLGAALVIGFLSMAGRNIQAKRLGTDGIQLALT